MVKTRLHWFESCDSYVETTNEGICGFLWYVVEYTPHDFSMANKG